MYATVHREKGRPIPLLKDFMPHLKAWPEVQTGRYSEVDKEIFGLLL